MEIENLASTHTGYDAGEIVYVDYEGIGTGISNYYDITGVYMVKHGVGNTATGSVASEFPIILEVK